MLGSCSLTRKYVSDVQFRCARDWGRLEVCVCFPDKNLETSIDALYIRVGKLMSIYEIDYAHGDGNIISGRVCLRILGDRPQTAAH